jgi:hypothetical protein
VKKTGHTLTGKLVAFQTRGCFPLEPFQEWKQSTKNLSVFLVRILRNSSKSFPQEDLEERVYRISQNG